MQGNGGCVKTRLFPLSLSSTLYEGDTLVRVESSASYSAKSKLRTTTLGHGRKYNITLAKGISLWSKMWRHWNDCRRRCTGEKVQESPSSVPGDGLRLGAVEWADVPR